MTTAEQLGRNEIVALPPTITLETLGRCIGVSEPTVREANKRGELAALGIRINKIGAQYRVVTSTVWEYLGLVKPRAAEPVGPSAPALSTARRARDVPGSGMGVV